jgi:hypothetical protein
MYDFDTATSGNMLRKFGSKTWPEIKNQMLARMKDDASLL